MPSEPGARRFAGKVALVTGGSRGIGRAITLKLAAEGADVVINYFRRRETAEEAAKEAESFGVRTHIVKANIGEPEKIDAMFAEIEAKFGRLDMFISNAASGVPRTAMDLDERGWDWTMGINARAFLLGARKAATMMTGGGKMVAISSLGSQMVMPLYTAVGVSKAALEALVRYLAIELAPRGICVNGVSAAAVETESLKLYATMEGMPRPAWNNTPAGRMVRPEDVADAVVFLCSEEAVMVRGQIILVDGGVSICPVGPHD